MRYGEILYGQGLYAGASGTKVSNLSDITLCISSMTITESDLKALINRLRETHTDISAKLVLYSDVKTDCAVYIGLDKSYLSDSKIVLTVPDEIRVDTTICLYKDWLKNGDLIIYLGEPIIRLTDSRVILSDFKESRADAKTLLDGQIDIRPDLSILIYESVEDKEVLSDMTIKIWSNVRINGVDIGLSGFILTRDTQRDLIPEVNIRKVEIPNRDGCIIVGKDLSERIIQLALALDSDSEAEYLSTKRYLAQLISGDIDLVFEDEPDRHYFCRYAGTISLQEWIKSGLMTIPLRMADPYIYSNENILAGVGELNNQGTEPTDAVVTITGPVTAPWTLTLGSETLTISRSLVEGETCVVNTKDATIRVDGVNIMPDVEGDIPSIPVGVNVIDCSTLSISTTWRNKFLV